MNNEELDYAKYLVYLGLDGYETQEEHDKACEDHIKELNDPFVSLIYKRLPSQYTDALNPEVMHYLYKQAYMQGFEDAREVKLSEAKASMVYVYNAIDDALRARGLK